MKQVNAQIINDLIRDCEINSSSPQAATQSGTNPTITYILKEVQKEFALKSESLNLNSSEANDLVHQVSERLGFTISSQERDEILAYVEQGKKLFGILQDLVDDSSINDIIVTAYNKIYVQQDRKNHKTGLSFTNLEDYENFVEKLLTSAGSSYSTKLPISDGMIGTEARIHAVHKSICSEGPYLTVRINRYSEITIDNLLDLCIAPKPVLDYLTAIVSAGKTVLIAGEVGTGKTTLARALAATIPVEDSILVIEDTPEIQLLHPHVRYLRTRVANIEGEGKISPADCIRAGMRMAMNRIVFGEIRDAEAAEAFIDVCASGHSGISTIHSRNASDAVSRLELFLSRIQKSSSKQALTQQVGNAIQVIVHVNICKQTGKRRIIEVKEVGAFADSVLRQQTIFKYSSENNFPSWKVQNCVSNFKECLPFLNLNDLPKQLILDHIQKQAA